MVATAKKDREPLGFGEKLVLDLLSKRARTREELRSDTATRIGGQQLARHLKRLHAADMIRMGPKDGHGARWELAPKGAHAIGKVLDEELETALFEALAPGGWALSEAAVRVDFGGPEPIIGVMLRRVLVEELRQRARDCCDDLNTAANLIAMSDFIAKAGPEVPVLTVKLKSSTVSWIVREQPARAA